MENPQQNQNNTTPKTPRTTTATTTTKRVRIIEPTPTRRSQRVAALAERNNNIILSNKDTTTKQQNNIEKVPPTPFRNAKIAQRISTIRSAVNKAADKNSSLAKEASEAGLESESVSENENENEHNNDDEEKENGGDHAVRNGNTPRSSPAKVFDDVNSENTKPGSPRLPLARSLIKELSASSKLQIPNTPLRSRFSPFETFQERKRSQPTSLSTVEDSSDVEEEEEEDEVSRDEKKNGLPIYDVERVPSHLQKANVTTGYRADYTTTECLRSVFAWHNDTLNIWMNFVAFVLSAYVAVQTWTWDGEGFYNSGKTVDYVAPSADRFFVSLSCACMAAHYLILTTYCILRPHRNVRLFNYLSEYECGACFIAVFGIVSNFIHFAIYCDSDKQSGYLFAALALASLAFAFPRCNLFKSRYVAGWIGEYYHRAVVLGLCAIAGCAMADLGYFGTTLMMQNMWNSTFSISCLVIGDFLVSNFPPERQFPGKLDHALNSQHLWNAFGMMCAYGAYQTVLQIAEFRSNNDLCSFFT